MSALIVSATAWIPVLPEPVPPRGWIARVVHAEVSVTPSGGKPGSDLPESAFKTHLMLSGGLVLQSGVTLTEGRTSG